MQEGNRWYTLVLSLFLLLCLPGVNAQAAPTAAEITGEIERLTLNDPTNIYSGGVMIVAGSQVILPKNLLIDLPANRLSLQQIFAQAPAACISNGESGLAKADRCNSSGTGGFATLSGVHSTAGNIIAGDLLIEKGTDIVSGVISYINYTDGYFRVNGIPNDSATGAMVRLNDPTSRHTIQQGPGCAGGPNCSPDPRFTLDPDNYVNTFSSGYPFCIPSTVPRTFVDALGLGTTTAQSSGTGTGDVLCPSTNRTAALVEPAVNDSRLFAPIMVGDSIQAEGNYETVSGTRFLSSHTTRVNKALSTKNLPTQPDYLFLEEVFLEAPGFQNQRTRMLIIGFTTLAPTDVDFWTLHRDPVSNAIHEFPLASINGCDVAAGASSCSNQGLIGAGANIFRIRYDVDFLLAAANDPKYPGGAAAKLNPCLQLKGSARFTASNPGICASGITLANNFGIMSPIPREIQARTGHSLDHPGLITLDIRGNQATNGQYLFPFGINLGGVETADFLEVDINLLNTPRIFEGIPWNLDRRLSPSGCLNAGGCEVGALGSFALDPFPYTGLDPRTQADFLVGGTLPGGTPKGSYSDANFTNSLLGNASNRVFSYVSGTPFAPNSKFNFDGNNTFLPCATGACPADPSLITINPTPVLNIFPPIAIDDADVTTVGTQVTISVLNNDIPILGNIDPLSVTIVTPPVSGKAVVNLPAGTITYTPASGAPGGTVTFTYTVANNFGSVSLPGTVTVTVAKKPVAVNDSVSTPAKSVIPINLLTNDIAGTSSINLASVNITSGPSCGSLANQNDGTVLFTAPNTAPAAPGACIFTYYVSDISVAPLLSNVATVTVTVTPPAAPVAGNIVTVANTNSTTAINVINSVTSAVSTISPASLSVTAATGGSAAANANGSVSYTAPATPGTYSFTYTMKDNAVPQSTSNIATVTVTVSTPSTLVITNATLANGTAATAYSQTLAATGGTAPYTWAVAPLSTLPAGLTLTAAGVLAGTPTTAGTFTFSLQVTDSRVPAVTTVKAFTVVVSPQVFTGSISINGGSLATSNPKVTLTLSATSSNGAVTQMQFSKDRGLGWFALEPFSTTRIASLLGTQGANTMSVRFSDATGILSPIYTASIIFDTVAPTGTIAVTSPNPTNLTTGTLSLTATDNVGGSGVTQMQFSTNNGASFLAPEPFATTRTVSLPAVGIKTFTVHFMDAAGNISGNQNVSITRQ